MYIVYIISSNQSIHRMFIFYVKDNWYDSLRLSQQSSPVIILVRMIALVLLAASRSATA